MGAARTSGVSACHTVRAKPAAMSSREQAIDELQRAGLADVVALVDTNLMLARLDPRLPDGVEAQLARMLVLGEETAVFIAPPGSF